MGPCEEPGGAHDLAHVHPAPVQALARVVDGARLEQWQHVVHQQRVHPQIALPGEGCPKCGQPLSVERVIEVGNIFKLGTKYSEPLGAMYLDEQGQQKPIVMGSYGIGPARIAAAAVEQRHDADGIVWPWAIAPFHVHIVPVAVKDAAQMAAATEIEKALEDAGFEVLMDDRDERAGVKFKDADLLGVPIRVTVGNALAKEGVVEIRERATRAEWKVPRERVLEAIRKIVDGLAMG